MYSTVTHAGRQRSLVRKEKAHREVNITLTRVLQLLWEFCKIGVLPLCIWILQRQITKRDEKREREIAERKKELDSQAKQNLDIQYLLMQRIDKLSEMTHLMAVKLHEKKIINGDLEALDKKYKELDAEYEEEVKRLALMYSRR